MLLTISAYRYSTVPLPEHHAPQCAGDPSLPDAADTVICQKRYHNKPLYHVTHTRTPA